jgi:hydrogenase expression/formation protein HypE
MSIPSLTDCITLAHGNGGRLTRELVETLFVPALGNPFLDTRLDGARVRVDGADIVLTTDGFTVQPLEFPGGDIGSLAVHGTINDLAVMGATPLYMTLSILVEEGQNLQQLRRVIDSLGRAAAAAGVHVVTGDTKVVRRGEGGGLYLSVTGVGARDRRFDLDLAHVRPGDSVLVSGPLGDHGTAVLLAREEFGLRGDVTSDTASVMALTTALADAGGVRFMRDPTRGGLATVAHEISHGCGHGIRLRQADIPVREPVQAVCEILGYDPLYLACEGRVVAVIKPERATAALAAWRALPQGQAAAIIGTVTDGAARVVLETSLGGERLLEELEDDPLPRIC